MALIVALTDGGEDRYKYMRGDTARVHYEARLTADGGLDVVEVHLHLVPPTGEWIKQFERAVSFYEKGEWVSFDAAPTKPPRKSTRKRPPQK